MIEKVLTFYLCGTLLGIDVTLIKEFNRNVEYTPVPGAYPHILGLFNMRGQVVTLYNLEMLLGLEDTGENKMICVILKVPRDPDQVGFFVNQPGDVIDIDVSESELPPANIGVEGEFINNVVKLKEELLIVVDPAKIFKTE